MIIESHAHLTHMKFDGFFRYLDYDRAAGLYTVCKGDRAALIGRMRAAGVGAVVEPAIDLASNRALMDLAAAEPGWLFPAVGLHPTRTSGAPWAERALLEELSRRPEVVAIGETGLDYHYPRAQQHRRVQLRWFVYQILLAYRRRLPLILHLRDADRDALTVLRLFRPFLRGGVAHCFYGDAARAQTLMKLGFHLGIGGTLLQDNDAGRTLCETVRSVPLERILLETDAPYVHPSCEVLPGGKVRGKVRNTSLILPAVAARIALLKGLSPEAVERQTAANAATLFGLDPALRED